MKRILYLDNTTSSKSNFSKMTQNDQIVIHKLFYGMINNFTSVKERDLTLFQRV